MSAVRLLSWNILSGRSLQDGRVEPGRLEDAVRSVDADVVALQEVDRHQPRSGGAHQAADLAAALGTDHWRYVETVHGTPGEPGWIPAGAGPPPPGPGYGVALLSRLPVLHWDVLRLRPARGRFPLAIPGRPPRMMWLHDEPRAVVAAVLAQPRITVACTHLSFVPFMNARQLRRVARWLRQFPGPHLLLGDLNMGPRPAGRVSGWQPLFTASTYPAPAPRMQLDHALAGDLPPGADARAATRRMPLSDHCAVVVDLTLPEPPPGR